MKEIAELWKEYNVSAQLLKDKLGRTSNLVGEYAEYLVNEYLKGELLLASNASADIQLSNGDLYQVKSRKVGNSFTTQLSVIRSWDFDYLTVVLFDKNGSVQRALICSKSVCREYAAPNKHQNGWVISTTNNFLTDQNHRDITNQLRDLNNDNKLEFEILPVIKQNNTKPKNDYSLSNRKEIEIDKVIRKLPKWFNKPENINTRILIIFLELEKKLGSVDYETLAGNCSGINTFKENFAQMKNFGQKNNGKVFEQTDSLITLWNPVKNYIILEYNKHYEGIKTHYNSKSWLTAG